MTTGGSQEQFTDLQEPVRTLLDPVEGTVSAQDVAAATAAHLAPRQAEPAHDAFISYSRKDSAFAERLQKSLEKYVPPTGIDRERRRLRVFRDQHDFTGIDYYAAIQKHLAGARKLIVVCSPDAATSRYVDDEIERFVQLHGAQHLVPVLYRGLPNNEAGTRPDAEPAFPAALVRALEMPLAADFRGLESRSGRIDGGVHEAAWMLLLANLLDVSRANLEQRELQRRRRVRRIWTTGVGAVLAALTTLTVWALFEGERALARQLAAEAALPGGLDVAQVERNVLLARESMQRAMRLGDPTLDAETALRQALAEVPRRRLSLPAGEREVAFAGDGNHLLSAEGRRLFVYSLAGRNPVREVALVRPLRRLVTGSNQRFVAGIDEAGLVRIWSWPDFALLDRLPSVVSTAPVQCLTFADGGATAVALRVTEGYGSRAELLRWRPGETTLVASASVTVPQPVRARAGAHCLTVRKHSNTMDEAVMVSLDQQPSSDGSRVTILRWPLRNIHPIATTGARAEPIQVWSGVLAGELDHNINAVLLLPDGQVLRDSNLNKHRVPVVPKWSSAQSLAAGGGWLVASQSLEDPYVPLLKSTRFDIVDTNSGAVMQSVGDHAGQAFFTPDTATLVTIAGARLRLWDRRDGRERLRLFAAAPVESVSLDPSSRQLAAVTADGALEIFDIGAPDEMQRVAPNVLLAPLAMSQGIALADGQRLLLSPSDGTPLQQLPLERHAHGLQASPDGRWLALFTTPDEPVLKIGDPPHSELWLVRSGAEPSVSWRGPVARHLRFDRASRRLLTVGEDGMVRLFDLTQPSVAWERQIESATTEPYWNRTTSRYRVALSDDGETVAIGSDNGLVLLSGRDGSVLRRDPTPTQTLALSADGRLLARLAKDKVEILRVADGTSVAHLERRGVASVRELIFSPLAKRLMAVGGTSFSTFFGGGLFVEEHLVVWDLASGHPELRLPDSLIEASDYQTNIGSRADERRQLSSVVWNAHTREVAGTVYPSMLAYWTVPSTMVPGRLTAWKLTDDGLVEIYRGSNREKLDAKAFAAAGGALVVTGDDGYRRIIDLSGSGLLAKSCDAVRREWTDAERRKHLGSGWRGPLRCRVDRVLGGAYTTTWHSGSVLARCADIDHGCVADNSAGRTRCS